MRMNVMKTNNLSEDEEYKNENLKEDEEADDEYSETQIIFIWNEKEFEDNILLHGNTKTEP